jgi:hypothetical protein
MPATEPNISEVEHLLTMHANGAIPDAELPCVSLPPLPEQATPGMRRVAALFALVHALRQWAGMPSGVCRK